MFYLRYFIYNIYIENNISEKDKVQVQPTYSHLLHLLPERTTFNSLVLILLDMFVFM